MSNVEARPELVVMDMDDAREYEPKGNEACVSILSPYPTSSNITDDKHAEYVSDKFADVLYLRFHDIDHDMIRRHGGKDRRADIEGISRDQAREVVNFIVDNAMRDRIVLHCEAGVSRSPGIALAAMRILPGYTSQEALEAGRKFSLHNSYVRRLVVEEAYGMNLLD